MSNSNWRILISKETDPFYNMAMEKALFSAVEQCHSTNIIRFWRNNRSAIIGISEKPEEVLNLESCSQYDVSILKRFTGGGAVYHDLGNLNWTFICKRKGSILKYNEDIINIYGKFLNPIISSLKILGINAEIKYINNIFLSGYKISGSAIRIKRNAAICHGTILLDSDLNILKSVLKELKYPVINIKNIINFRINYNLLIKEIVKNFQAIYSIKTHRFKITDLEQKLIKMHLESVNCL